MPQKDTSRLTAEEAKLYNAARASMLLSECYYKACRASRAANRWKRKGKAGEVEYQRRRLAIAQTQIARTSAILAQFTA